ncbi:MAG: hypothetical protein KME14_24010 [Tildeniella torsiva UHER 1998/13D]|nr:hypothetical protein [Tildeniella torsiva UHER 1998/13D]
MPRKILGDRRVATRDRLKLGITDSVSLGSYRPVTEKGRSPLVLLKRLTPCSRAQPPRP